MREFEQIAEVGAVVAVGVFALVLTYALVRRRPVLRVEALFRQGRYVDAGELAQDAGLLDRAIDCFVEGGHHERAARCAVRGGHTELAAELYEKAGDAKRAAFLYEKAGRGDKAAALRPDPDARANRTTTLTVALQKKVTEESQAGVTLEDLAAQDAAAAEDSAATSPEPSSDGTPVAPPLALIHNEPSPVCLDVLKRVKQLEALPIATGRVLRLLDDPHASPKTVARELERDQQLATMVLRAANSAYYGASGQVRDVGAALVLIGFDAMRQLVVARLSRQTMRKKNDRISRVLWKHALATAVGAQAIARSAGGILPGHAFTSGLLHDIGKSVLYQAFPDEYAMVWVHSEQDPRASHEIESERFGTDHAEVGAEMLRIWRIPAIYAMTTLAHHTSTDEASLPTEEARLHSCIVLASAISSWMGHGRFPARPLEQFERQTAMDELQAKDELIVDVAGAIERDLAGYEGVFG